MRRLLATLTGAFALLLAPALAAGYTGGAAYPLSTGGTGYGATPTARPVASLFEVSPLAVTEGSLPRVRFRVDEGGVSHVRVRLAIVPLVSGTGDAVSLPLGSFAPGRATEVKWPRRPRLAAGRYLVRLHVVDPRGRTLLRAAGASGRQTLTVREAPAPLPPPTPVADAVFPVAGPHTYGDGFGAARKGYRHQGQDVLAAEGTQVVAPTAGTVAFVGYQAGAAGYWVLEHATDGRDFFFAHCQAGSTSVSQGQSVAAGAPLCRVGHTGDATGPHLHFELWVGGWHAAGGAPIDPLAQLRSWDAP